MKIRVVFKIFIISFILSSSFYSFSQTNAPVVQIYDTTKVSNDYILWISLSKCTLIDRKGNTLFSFPGNLASILNKKKLIVAHTDSNLVVYNKNLDVVMRADYYIHHDVTITPEENFLFLSDEYDTINNINVRFDNIVCLDSAGNKIYNWSTLEHRRYLMEYIMKDPEIFRYKINGAPDPDSVLFNIAPTLFNLQQKGMFDARELLHINAIQVIPANESEKKDPVFREGNILLSFCNYNDSISSFIAIVEPVHFQILWYYVQPDKRVIHMPTMLPNGNILIFVNSRCNIVDLSSVEEINPVTKKLVWYYVEPFLTVGMCQMGSCQRLSDGNTLISNTNGYIYEVTPDKKIVWQWYNNNDRLYRAYFYPKEKLKWLINKE